MDILKEEYLSAGITEDVYDFCDEICSILDDKKYTSNQKKILDAFGIPEIPRMTQVTC